jgi:hypothetical protein
MHYELASFVTKLVTKLVMHYEYLSRNEARYEARNAPVYNTPKRSAGPGQDRVESRCAGASLKHAECGPPEGSWESREKASVASQLRRPISDQRVRDRAE